VLDHLRIVEVGQVLAAPYAAMVFADLGAEVIKVEKPGVGDDARAMGAAFRDDASMTFHEVNRGKRSVVIDLKTEDGKRALLNLLQTADVFMHNLRPGESAKLGIDAPNLCAHFPQLIYCAMSAFGHKGPRRLQPGYEPLLQAFGGLISINGTHDGPPARVGVSLVDQGTAMWTVIGILTALLRRGKTGQGCVVNTSLLETAMGWTAPRINEFLNQGRPALRHGTAHPNLVPYQAFDTPSGQIMLCAGNDRLFAKLARALAREDWLQDPRFCTNRQRVRNRSALVAQLQDLLARMPREHWITLLEPLGVPVGPVNTIAELVRESQVAALDMIRPVADRDFVLTGIPVSFDGVRPPVLRPAPTLGADNAQFLCGSPSTNHDDKDQG